MKAILTLFAFFITLAVSAQSHTASGFVRDAQSGEALVGATVYAPSLKSGVASNKYGYYSLQIEGKNTEISFSLLGYKTLTVKLNTAKDTLLNVDLEETSKELNEVTIKAEKQEYQNLIGAVHIPIKELKQVPTLFGEPDILKALATTPGVNTGKEGTSGILVRGGTPDQNLILLDDAPVYNVSHLFGFVSVFNPDAIKDVSLYKSAFPARYGGRLSSVLDIGMKEGNKKIDNVEGSVGLISSKVLLEGPISKTENAKASYLVSARSSYIGILLLPLYIAYKAGSAESFGSYWMYDLNAKINYDINPKSQIFLSFYTGKDALFSEMGNESERFKNNINWGNATTTLRHNYVLSQKLFSKSTLTFSNYRSGFLLREYIKENGTKTAGNQFQSFSKIRDFSLKQHFDWYPTNALHVQYGFDFVRHRFNPVQLKVSYKMNADTLAKINQALFANEAALFVEKTLKIGQILNTHAGIRLVNFQAGAKNYQSAEPRLGINLNPVKNISLKLGYNQGKQFLHLLNNSTIGLTNDIWLPATSSTPPQQVQQFSLGLSKQFPKNGLEVSIEAYKKTWRNLIDYQQDAGFLTTFNQSVESVLEKNGEGRGKGLELFVRKHTGKTTGWLAYTLAKNERRFQNINEHTWYAAPHDRRHVLALNIAHERNKRNSFALGWQYHSGDPTTVPIAVHQDYFQGWGLSERFVYGYRNNYRMPAYHRLDVSYTYTKWKTNWEGKNVSTSSWTFGMYNAYARFNPFYLNVDITAVVSDKEPWLKDSKRVSLTNKLFQVGIFPIIPYFSYHRKIK